MMPLRGPGLDRSEGNLRRPAGVATRAQARPELALFLGRLAKLGGVICLLLVAGMLGFAVAEETSLWIGFVWTLDTIATVGSIPSPETTGGQILKVLLIVLGVGTLFYALVALTEFFVAGHVTGLLDERRRQRMVDALSDHYLVCGFGRVGRQVVRDLRAAGAEYVVIDRNPESLEAAAAAGTPYLEGEAADEQLLRRAGIERARALVACVDSDAENVFITLTARELRPDLTIVARASGEESERKLKRAGAQRVVSPYKSSGSEMARLGAAPAGRGRGRRRTGVPDGGDRSHTRLPRRRPPSRRRRRLRHHRGAAPARRRACAAAVWRHGPTARRSAHRHGDGEHDGSTRGALGAEAGASFAACSRMRPEVTSDRD
jgi:voltage-gated potassium channel